MTGKEKILQYNGIISENNIKKNLFILNCPRCELVNAIENKYFSSCGHMNDTGARIFTARILKDFFKK